jgi:hypothetical protein
METGKDGGGSGCDLFLKYYPVFPEDGLRKTTKELIHDKRGSNWRYLQFPATVFGGFLIY